MLKCIKNELNNELPDFEQILNNWRSKGQLIFPSSYREKIRVCLSSLRHLLDNDLKPSTIGWIFCHGLSNVDSITRCTLEALFRPFWKYIDEKVDGMDSLLYLLSKFKLETEWFEKKNLYEFYQEDTRIGEKILDSTLRKFLFNKGLDFPFSQPLSPSGRTDILPIINQNPIPLEVKLFDGKGRDRSYLRQGVSQVLNYTNDYNSPNGYLVIFNISELNLIFKLNSDEIPQRLVIGDKTIFLIIVELYPHEQPASKRKLKPYHIEENSLVS